jgi:thiamine biosynthesis lipoprotein ApbE
MQLNLGVIAKGYAMDQAAQTLQKNNAHNPFIYEAGDLKNYRSWFSFRKSRCHFW